MKQEDIDKALTIAIKSLISGREDFPDDNQEFIKIYFPEAVNKKAAANLEYLKKLNIETSNKPIGDMTEEEILKKWEKILPKVNLYELSGFMKDNSMSQIEEKLTKYMIFTYDYDNLENWLYDEGIETIEKWRQKSKTDEQKEYEKERWPEAYKLKKSLIYYLDCVYDEWEQDGVTDELNVFLTQKGLSVKNKIENVDKSEQEKTTSQKQNDLKAVLDDMNNTFSKLIKATLIIFKKNNKQYIMAEDSSIPKIITELNTLLENGTIKIPQKERIGSFIKNCIRDKDGNQINKKSVDAAMRRKNKK